MLIASTEARKAEQRAWVESRSLAGAEVKAEVKAGVAVVKAVLAVVKVVLAGVVVEEAKVAVVVEAVEVAFPAAVVVDSPAAAAVVASQAVAVDSPAAVVAFQAVVAEVDSPVVEVAEVPDSVVGESRNMVRWMLRDWNRSNFQTDRRGHVSKSWPDFPVWIS